MLLDVMMPEFDGFDVCQSGAAAARMGRHPDHHADGARP